MNSDTAATLRESERPTIGGTMPEHDAAFSILIVEGDFLRARLLSESLRSNLNGSQIHVARDGEHAFETINRHRPRVILLNMNLSRPSGVEFLRMLSKGTLGDEIRLVALTQRGQGDMQVAAKLFGASAVIECPYSPPELSRAVQQAGKIGNEANVR